jgi:hypothetical protein
MLEGLMRVSNDFKIPMGIAWVNTPSARTKAPSTWQNVTVLQIIVDLAKKERVADYRVRVENGVVHVSPTGLIPDRANILNLKIRDFEVRNEYIEMASFKLHNTVTPPAFAGFSVGATGDSRVSVALKNATLGTVLDALIIASNRKIWIVTFADDPKLTPSGLRRTMSLFTDAPIPDGEQPVWDLHRWGDPIPPLASAAK